MVSIVEKYPEWYILYHVSFKVNFKFHSIFLKPHNFYTHHSIYSKTAFVWVFMTK